MAQSMKEKYEKHWGDIENLKNISASNRSNCILYITPHSDCKKEVRCGYGFG